MDISKQKGSNLKTGLCKLKFRGELSIYDAEAAMGELLPYFDDYKNFELDLSDISEFDSAGVQILLLGKKEASLANKPLVITKMSASVEELLELYRLRSLFQETTENDTPSESTATPETPSDALFAPQDNVPDEALGALFQSTEEGSP